MDKLEKIHARIAADLREWQELAAETTPPEGMEQDFLEAIYVMYGAEYSIRNAPCFGGGGSNPCPPVCC